MQDNLNKMKKCLNNLSVRAYVSTSSLIERNQTFLLFILGSGLLFHSTQDSSLAQIAGGGAGAGGAGGGITSGYTGLKYGEVCSRILDMHADGGYGSLLATIAGIGAIISSAMGGFKAAWGLIIVAISSFILDAYRTLFFGNSCGGPF